MKIKSNKTFDCYETAYESWRSGKDITLDGIKLIPITILDKIRAEIEKLRPNLRPEQMTDYDYAMIDVVNDIVAIIDKVQSKK